jgi:hypothetical protein
MMARDGDGLHSLQRRQPMREWVLRAFEPGPWRHVRVGTHCAPPAQTGGCASLALCAEEGTFLGNATSNAFDPNGVCNTFRTYGSMFSPTSIHNMFGLYGSTFGIDSAYNPSSFTPPHLVCTTTGAAQNYVTKNVTLPSRVDPDNPCSVLAAAGY